MADRMLTACVTRQAQMLAALPTLDMLHVVQHIRQELGASRELVASNKMDLLTKQLAEQFAKELRWVLGHNVAAKDLDRVAEDLKRAYTKARDLGDIKLNAIVSDLKQENDFREIVAKQTSRATLDHNAMLIAGLDCSDIRKQLKGEAKRMDAREVRDEASASNVHFQRMHAFLKRQQKMLDQDGQDKAYIGGLFATMLVCAADDTNANRVHRYLDTIPAEVLNRNGLMVLMVMHFDETMKKSLHVEPASAPALDLELMFGGHPIPFEMAAPSPFMH